jgi:hypothetical protein
MLMILINFFFSFNFLKLKKKKQQQNDTISMFFKQTTDCCVQTDDNPDDLERLKVNS